jgi:hypothetical protein
MGLTGKFRFRKTLWGKIVLQIEDEVKPFWSKAGALKRRWRDATLMDLAAPEMRPLIDMRFKPHLWARGSLGLEAASVLRDRDEVQAKVDRQAPVPKDETRRVAH